MKRLDLLSTEPCKTCGAIWLFHYEAKPLPSPFICPSCEHELTPLKRLYLELKEKKNAANATPPN